MKAIIKNFNKHNNINILRQELINQSLDILHLKIEEN